MRCVYPEPTEPDGRCPHSARSRGCCHNHYQTAQAMLRDGRAELADLEARGLYMPKGEGSSPTTSSAAFAFDSKALGFAPRGLRKRKERAATRQRTEQRGREIAHQARAERIPRSKS